MKLFISNNHLFRIEDVTIWLKKNDFPKNQYLLQSLLQYLLEKEFVLGTTYSDQEVRDRLKKYYPDEYPTIRRDLVNYGYFKLDPINTTYTVMKMTITEQDIQNNSVLTKEKLNKKIK